MKRLMKAAALVLAVFVWAALSIYGEATTPRPTFAAVAAQTTWSR